MARQGLSAACEFYRQRKANQRKQKESRILSFLFSFLAVFAECQDSLDQSFSASLYLFSSLQKYIVESLSTFEEEELEEGDDAANLTPTAKGLRNAFKRLDNDISTEALPVGGAVYMEALQVALSGACACVAHVDDLDVHVANVGDARAVIGQTDGNGSWTAHALTSDHSTSSEAECDRIKRKHPSEDRTVIKNNRLLGQLIPLRAFGDMRFKWSMNDLKSVVNILDTPYARNIIPQNYYTPPYLSCDPEVTVHRLTSRDRFMVLGSDGLWEQLSDENVVKIVGEFLEGKEISDRFRLTGPMTLGELNQDLQVRRVCVRVCVIAYREHERVTRLHGLVVFCMTVVICDRFGPCFSGQRRTECDVTCHCQLSVPLWMKTSGFKRTGDHDVQKCPESFQQTFVCFDKKKRKLFSIVVQQNSGDQK